MNEPRRRRTDATILAVAGALALAVPLLTSAHLRSRIDRGLAPALADVLGETVDVGDVEVELTGAIRFTDVTVGAMFSARAVEAAVTLGHLVAGDIRADEIRVEQPRLRMHVDSRGNVDATRVLRRAWQRARARRGATDSRGVGKRGAEPRLRRIVVTGGALRVDLHGKGTMRVGDVSLVPHGNGLRVVAADTTFDVAVGPWRVAGDLARTGADLDMSRGTFSRMLAVGGSVSLRSPSAPSMTVVDPALGFHLRPDRTFELRGRVRRAGEDGRVFVHSTGLAPQRFLVRAERLPLAAFSAALPGGVVVRTASATGAVTLDVSNPAATAATVDANITGAYVHHPHVAEQRVDVDGRIQLQATLHRGEASHLHVPRLVYTRGDIVLSAAARLTPAIAPRRGRVSLALANTTCAGALSSLPAPLRSRLAGLGVTGHMDATTEVAFDRDAPDQTSLDLRVNVAGCRVTREAIQADPSALRHASEHRFPDGSRATVGFGEGSYATLRSLPAHVIGAFVAAEDARFYRHTGFDVDQLERSLGINLALGEFQRGGSTISQQLVKNVYFSPVRSLSRKLQEAVLTWRLEARLTKRQILERYLNIIELGVGVFGIHAAAQHWFDKPPQNLSVHEAAFLAALTPAPRTITRRIHRANRIDDATLRRVRTVLRAMRRAGVITKAEANRAEQQPLAISRAVLARR